MFYHKLTDQNFTNELPDKHGLQFKTGHSKPLRRTSAR